MREKYWEIEIERGRNIEREREREIHRKRTSEREILREKY